MKSKILETVPVRWKRRVNLLTTCSCGEENKETTGLVRLNLPKIMMQYNKCCSASQRVFQND